MNGAWQGGDYIAAGDAWAHAADDVVAMALAGLGPRGEPDGPTTRVLDVGSGCGPAALAMARAGMPVVGLDLEPGLLRVASARAREAGLGDRARFVVGDAVALPFPAGTFDVVVSTFGVMFAPDPGRVAAELVRVCRAGGVIAVASWTPDGVMGRIAQTVLSHLEGRPDAPSPTSWGDPAHVSAWFTPLAAVVRTRIQHVQVAYPSVEHAVHVFENKPGPLRAHRAALQATGRWSRARTALAELFHDHNRADDGSLLMDVPYLSVLGQVPASGAGQRS